MVCYALLPSDLHLAPMNHGFFFSALRRPWNAFLARLIKRPMLHFQEYFPAAAPTYVPRELRVSMDDVVAHHPRLTHQKIIKSTNAWSKHVLLGAEGCLHHVGAH